MEVEIEINSCRVCLKNVGETPLFNNLGEENPAEMINSLFNIEVICNDNLPNALCSRCLDNIKIAFKTKEDIINSEVLLNSYLETAAELPEHFLQEINNTAAEPESFLQGINHKAAELPQNSLHINVEDKIVTSKLVGLDIEHLYIENIEDSTLDSEVVPTKITNVPTTSFESSKIYDCERCNFKTDTYKLFFVHMRRTHQDINLFECEQCGKEYATRSKYIVHSCPNRIYKPYKCDVCMKRFSTRSYLDQHLITHNTERIIPCPQCDKMFCHMKALKAHLLTHNEKNVICEVCGKKFKHTTFLKTHIATTHGNVSRRSTDRVTLHQEVACEWCGKLIFLNRLRSHIKNVHLEKKPFKCPFCDRTFSTSQNLNYHIQYHANSKSIPADSETLDQYLKYKCDKCDKAFTSSINFKNHNIRHSGLKEHVCPHCGKEFAFKHYLDRHIRLAHDTTNPRNFVCKVCGKVYVHSWDLNAHLVVHTGELPYHCNFCDIRFRYSTSLRRHMSHKHQTKVRGQIRS